VYIAALPGKKAAGVCRTKRGNYGRAVIETDYIDKSKSKTARFLASFNSRQRQGHSSKSPLEHCLAFSEDLR
jgi:hypothetical protein